jgi:hypothetical protein
LESFFIVVAIGIARKGKIFKCLITTICKLRA